MDFEKDQNDDEIPAGEISSNPLLIQRTGIKSVVAVSDIHGWYRPLVELLEKSGIIKKIGKAQDDDGQRGREKSFKVENDLFQYRGGSTIIVIAGDFVDVDSEGRKVLELIINLEGAALNAGGELISLSGNHERFFLDSDKRYWGKIGEYKKWIEKRPLMAIVNNILFVHAGISDKALKIVDEGKRDGEDFICAFKRGLCEDERLGWEVTNRMFSLRDEVTLGKVIDLMSVDYMVVGHTSTYGKKRSEIRLVGPKIDGKPRVFNIDTEMGDWFKGFEGQKRNNGGVLFLKWIKEGELDTEYVYREQM